MASSGRRPPSILIIVENLPVPFDRRVWSEATTLREAGYGVSVICPVGVGAEKRHEIIDGINIYRHPLPLEARGARGYLVEYSSALYWELILSLKVLVKHGFDAVHACNPPDLIFLIGGLYKYLLGKKFVFDHHDINPELYEAKFGRRGLFWRLLVLFERMTFGVADMSIATNDSYRQIAIGRGRMDPERVHVVRSGPNLGRVRSLPADPAWRKGRDFLVAYVGVIGQQEGIDLLLEAVADILGRGRTDTQFVVMGSGPELDACRKLADRLNVSDYVTFTGRVSDETLFTVLSTADVCVNPDRPNEMNDKSTMNKIMEYMALGKAIVQFDLREGRVSAEDASLYARDVPDFADKILELLSDPARREEMGRKGRERVHGSLSWSTEAPKLVAAYNSLLESAARAGQGAIASSLPNASQPLRTEQR